MAEGILILPAFLGALIGYAIRNMYLTHMIGFVLLLNTSFTYYDTVDKDGIESLATETILIHASQAKIWDVLSHRVRFTAHGNLFFRAGVSHPTSMQLSYDNNKKCFLNCELSNGFAALAIEKLDSLRQIRFSIPDEVRTMKELTFYDSLDAPHLQGYFDASYGEFIIKPISENQCQLIANTKYKYRITPAFYWQWWSDYLVNAMHRHVLEDIRALAESK
ncbi:hypothetical protein WSM22_01840 [Cytophagales bacterium WSM2-2]|nr:hypothetical protein WSM22_01840 [Cytophagales bacterium WSM2-2]